MEKLSEKGRNQQIERIGKRKRVLFLLPLKAVVRDALESLSAEKYDVLVLLHGVSKKEFIEYQKIQGFFFHELCPCVYKNLSAVLNFGLKWAEANGYEYAARIDGADQLKPEVFNDNFRHVVGSGASFAAFSRRRPWFYHKSRHDSRRFSFLDAAFENTFIHSTFILMLGASYVYDEKRAFAQDFALLMKHRTRLSVLCHCHVIKGFSAEGASHAKRVEQLGSCICTLVDEGKCSVGWVLAVLPRALKISLLTFKRLKKHI